MGLCKLSSTAISQGTAYEVANVAVTKNKIKAWLQKHVSPEAYTNMLKFIDTITLNSAIRETKSLSSIEKQKVLSDQELDEEQE